MIPGSLPRSSGWLRRDSPALIDRKRYQSFAAILRNSQLETHPNDFINAYNYARRLKTLKGLTPYEYICKRWTKEPDRFIFNPLQQIPRLTT